MARKSYEGRDVTVSFDPEVCQHSGNCAKGLGAVFDPARKPWIEPDNAGAEDVVAQVAKCPSGALRIEERPSRC
jgi:uncharacterized Fe-S cluster protein YjdI